MRGEPGAEVGGGERPLATTEVHVAASGDRTHEVLGFLMAQLPSGLDDMRAGGRARRLRAAIAFGALPWVAGFLWLMIDSLRTT